MNKGSKEANVKAPLFELDASGKVTRLRGEALPEGLVHSVADTSLPDRSPVKDSGWVVRGAYKFVRRVQGKSE